jgi:alkanesulfonate monooxygenase SsuD/methylene tetrahydromethanopterin reductase-like flavin-dependent oxidoreductase (luciferase family)
MSPEGIRRAARVADGLNPIGFSYDQLAATASGFRAAVQEAGRDPAALPIVVRINSPISPRPLPDDRRPFLGGAPEQIAADLARLAPLSLDQVFFASGFAPSLDDEVRLLDELQQAVAKAIG